MADTDGLILQVLPVADSDAEELADLAAELHAELLSVDAASVAPLPAEAAPEGAKGLGDVAGWLLVQFGTLDGLRAVVAAVRGWTSRTGRTVEVSIGGDHAEGDRRDLAAAARRSSMPGWPAMAPAADPLPGPRLALVVATSTYTDPGLRRLRAPARDADDLAQVLADPGIGGFTVTTVIDQPAQQVRLAIEDFLNGRGTGDLLLVYLSCHGLLDARRRLYFAATDTRKDRLGSTGVEAAWVLDQLEHCRARRQVLILDSCFSGAFAHGAKGEADLGLQDRFLGQGRGRVVLTASTATEYSFEGDPTDAATPAGSVFTAALVQGLRTGAADTDHDGHVSVDDAYAYVFDQVQAAGAAQTPQRWLYGAEGQILLARNPAGPTIIPAPLPESLRAGLDSPHPGIRIGAVTELGEWLTGDDPARAATARRHLQEVADTDIPRVAHTARTLLDTGTTAEPPAPDRQARGKACRWAKPPAAVKSPNCKSNCGPGSPPGSSRPWSASPTGLPSSTRLPPTPTA